MELDDPAAERAAERTSLVLNCGGTIMSPFSSRLILLASVVALVPVADGALAAEHHQARKSAHAVAMPDNSMARVIFNQADGVGQGIQDAERLNLIDTSKARELASEARQIRNEAARGNGSRELLARLDDVSQDLRAATGEAEPNGNGGDGGYYPDGYSSSFPR
ncbi:hypothetical protein [Mesorhizobium sp. 1M-11]|uniref:hypothetical protein n=1 Tax=Mesorhizobium sp. 1M-11 TaxID=1529006 RepID=UPI00128F63DD|nr:hypothetical protein [Mesorhizobium sp. 1M-11]